MKAYDSVNVADYMLSLAKSKGINLNVTQVQKILYIIYGYCLAEKDSIVLTEAPKAWPYGPVFPRSTKKVDFNKPKSLSDCDFNGVKEDTELVEIIGKAVDKYSKFSAGKLSEWSHMSGGPWDLTVKSEGFKYGDPIPNEFIKEYFQGLNIF